ncbi:hypothetical protein PMAYCL1PPCAC_02358, partial [Pristionchus mayeri]
MSDYVEVYDNCSPHGEDFQIYEENLHPLRGEKIEGWLRVFEDSLDLMTRSGHGHVRFSCDHPLPWHGGFCVARTDERSLICYKDEQSANRVGRRLPRTRLDGGIRSFLRHWKQNGTTNDYDAEGSIASSSSSNHSNNSTSNYSSKTLSRLSALREEGNYVTDFVPRYGPSPYGTVYRASSVSGYRNPAYYGTSGPQSKFSPMDSHHFFTMRPGQ